MKAKHNISSEVNKNERVKKEQGKNHKHKI